MCRRCCCINRGGYKGKKGSNFGVFFYDYYYWYLLVTRVLPGRSSMRWWSSRFPPFFYYLEEEKVPLFFSPHFCTVWHFMFLWWSLFFPFLDWSCSSSFRFHIQEEEEEGVLAVVCRSQPLAAPLCAFKPLRRLVPFFSIFSILWALLVAAGLLASIEEEAACLLMRKANDPRRISPSLQQNQFTRAVPTFRNTIELMKYDTADTVYRWIYCPSISDGNMRTAGRP